MIETGHAKAAAELLTRLGFAIVRCPGCFTVSPIEVAEILKDELRWEAGRRGISTEALQLWRKWSNAGFLCMGHTLTGRRCLNMASYDNDPSSFVPGKTDRCRLHQDKP